MRIHDLRHEAPNPHPKSQVVAQRTRVRKPEAVDCVVLHQAGVEFALSSLQLRRADGDMSLARARRALTVACHAMAFRDGTVALTAPPLWYIEHGNSLNGRSLGLEVDGLYPGYVGQKPLKNTEWTEFTDTTVDAAREALRLLVEYAREAGCPVSKIYAHRQSSSTRRADPGEQLWKAVVLEYAVPELGLETEVDVRFGSGGVVPKAWDPSATAPY